jgi:phage/conjugal plasmid C-4 type zinc finger TraR family protein
MEINHDLGVAFCMDEGDRGQRITERLRAWAVDLHLQRPKKDYQSLRQCIDCGETIAEARRKAQPGCTRCIECQAFYEKRK